MRSRRTYALTRQETNSGAERIYGAEGFIFTAGRQLLTHKHTHTQTHTQTHKTFGWLKFTHGVSWMWYWTALLLNKPSGTHLVGNDSNVLLPWDAAAMYMAPDGPHISRLNGSPWELGKELNSIFQLCNFIFLQPPNQNMHYLKPRHLQYYISRLPAVATMSKTLSDCGQEINWGWLIVRLIIIFVILPGVITVLKYTAHVRTASATIISCCVWLIIFIYFL